MKKQFCLLLAVVMLAGLCACGGEKPTEEIRDWTRQGYYESENKNTLSVVWMDLGDEAGWYAAYMNGEDPIEDSYGGMLAQEGNDLRGALASGGSKGELNVTISEEGEDGLLLAVEGGETTHFKYTEIPSPYAVLRVNTEGLGTFSCIEEGEEIVDDSPLGSLQYNLTAPTTYTLTAQPGDGWYFVKWTLNGEDYSTQPQIIVKITDDSDFVAVFEFDENDDTQNPVMNFIGEYACGRANALIEAEGSDSAKITILWGGSAWDRAKWVMSGKLDTESLTVDYTDCVKSIQTFGDDGSLVSEEVEYENGTGRIEFFEEGLGFSWLGNQSDQEDLVFTWSWEPGVDIDYGSSEIYTQEDLEEAVDEIMEAFSYWKGCELHSIRYAGDESCTDENLRWMNELDPEGGYTQVAEFLMNFHSPLEGENAWELDTEYTDYQWWLARSEDGGWDILTWGY